MMKKSTLPKAVLAYLSEMGKKGGATRGVRKGFAVSDARKAQAASVAARKRNTAARKAAEAANGAKVQFSQTSKPDRA